MQCINSLSVGRSVENKPKNDAAIHVMRWLAITAVIVNHLSFDSRYNQMTLNVISIFRQMSGWCVLCFFGISGYFVGGRDAVLPWMEKRAKRLLIPYFTVSIISFLALFLISKSGVYALSVRVSLGQFVQRLLIMAGCGPQFYFLPYLFIVSVIIFLSSRFISRPWLLFIFSMVVGIQSLSNGSLETMGIGWGKMPIYILAYCLGAWLVQAEVKNVYRVLFSGSVLAILMVFLGYGSWLCCLMLPWCVYYLIRDWGVVGLLGDSLSSYSSGAVYLWHAPLCVSIVSIVLMKLGVFELWNFFFTCMVAIVLCLIWDHVLGLLKIRRFFSL